MFVKGYQQLKTVMSITSAPNNHPTPPTLSFPYKYTAAIRAALIKNYKPATVNRVLYALLRLLKEALRLELISPVDYARAVDIESMKGTKELRGGALSQDEIDLLMQVCFSDRLMCRTSSNCISHTNSV